MNHAITAREYDGGIVAIDSGILRREMAACYLLETKSELALIEVGTNFSAGRILDVVERRGWAREQVSHVIVTHVHLDHAGGAGSLMQALPQATFVVHPLGARHMVDPSRLEASTRAVYGDAAFEATYGQLIPVPEQRVRTMSDGETLSIGGRELLFVDTPGHAKHHFCIWDQHTRGWFSGDTFGISYRDFDTAGGAFIFPTTTPTQFDPQALVDSIERLMERSPQYVYLTHFGRVGEPQRLAGQVIDGVFKLAAMAEKHAQSESRQRDIAEEMLGWMIAGLTAHGVNIPADQLADMLREDVSLNTMGLDCWLRNR
jgi:glyoxylase-like metal-dependent hydrolase (beta-lactamase superfamily II)